MKRSKGGIKLITALAIGALLWMGLTYLVEISPDKTASWITGIIGVLVVIAGLWFSGILPFIIHWVQTKLKK